MWGTVIWQLWRAGREDAEPRQARPRRRPTDGFLRGRSRVYADADGLISGRDQQRFGLEQPLGARRTRSGGSSLRGGRCHNS